MPVRPMPVRPMPARREHGTRRRGRPRPGHHAGRSAGPSCPAPPVAVCARGRITPPGKGVREHPHAALRPACLPACRRRVPRRSGPGLRRDEFAAQAAGPCERHGSPGRRSTWRESEPSGGVATGPRAGATRTCTCLRRTPRRTVLRRPIVGGFGRPRLRPWGRPAAHRWSGGRRLVPPHGWSCRRSSTHRLDPRGRTGCGAVPRLRTPSRTCDATRRGTPPARGRSVGQRQRRVSSPSSAGRRVSARGDAGMGRPTRSSTEPMDLPLQPMCLLE